MSFTQAEMLASLNSFDSQPRHLFVSRVRRFAGDDRTAPGLVLEHQTWSIAPALFLEPSFLYL